mgnify:CR=1 FL=1
MRLIASCVLLIYAFGVLAVTVWEVISMSGGGWGLQAVLLPALETGLSWPLQLYQALVQRY